jgi:hypothetical protein
MYGTTIWRVLLILSLAAPAMAQEPLRLTYRTYALGAHIADAEGTIGLGPWTYQLALSFHTTGVGRLAFGGHNTSSVYGIWQADRPAPLRYASNSVWRGEPRAILMDYAKGIPAIRQLLPPPEPEQEIVGADLRANSTDALSALAALMRVVAQSGRCDSTIRTFDGRRAADIGARTVGLEMLEADGHSSFSGMALRCDFVSRMLAGFRLDQADKTDYRPLHGSAWLAAAMPNQPPVPVRVTLETRWFGNATTYLTGVEESGRQ